MNFSFVHLLNLPTEQGDEWRFVQFNVNQFPTDVISIRAITKQIGQPMGDIAIDDVEVSVL